LVDEPVVMVSNELAELPPETVTGLGEKEALVEGGFPDTNKVTPELNPLSDVIVIVELPEPPSWIVRELEDADMEKSGGAGGGEGGVLG
jgi:hypothetical protein